MNLGSVLRFLLVEEGRMNWTDLRNRVGKFEIKKELIESEPELIRKFLSNVLIFRAEFVDFGYIIEYMGFSKIFSELPEGGVVPRYGIKLTETRAKKDCVMFGRKRKKDDQVLCKLEFYNSNLEEERE
jgi:hypothetical protein